MTDWKVYLAVALTGVCLLRSGARFFRGVTVLVHLALLMQYSIFLSNVGRNTFEHVERRAHNADTFREGVFAEAKAADSFAREQLIAVYVVAICLSVLALWPALSKRGSTPRGTAATRKRPAGSVSTPASAPKD